MSDREKHTTPNEELPEYQPPDMKVMTEAEMLSAIQINALGTSWWVM